MLKTTKITLAPIPHGLLFGSLAIMLGIFTLFIAILLNFRKYRQSEGARQMIKSPVDTLTMTLFALALYLVIIFRIGHLSFGAIDEPLRILGGLLFLLGTAVNLWGRKVLGDNWSDQIRIRESHTLITNGPFRYVRHPLYASIMLMQFAAALVYTNVAVFAINLLFYIPMMNYRAAQEEKALTETFHNYLEYCNSTGRFWPKFGGRHESR